MQNGGPKRIAVFVRKNFPHLYMIPFLSMRGLCACFVQEVEKCCKQYFFGNSISEVGLELSNIKMKQLFEHIFYN